VIQVFSNYQVCTVLTIAALLLSKNIEAFFKIESIPSANEQESTLKVYGLLGFIKLLAGMLIKVEIY
jgi:hypothetical protein